MGRLHDVPRHGERDVAPSGSKTTAWEQRRDYGDLGSPQPCESKMTGKGANNLERVGNPGLVGGGPVHSRGKGGAMPAEPARALEGIGDGTQSERETASGHRNGEWLITKLELIARRARQEPRSRFTSLAHLLDEGFLAQSYRELKKNKAPGVDGVSVEEYGKDLDGNLKRLVARMKAKKYWPQPVRRTYIPKGDGQLRPLGIPAVEDKVVQMGMARILQAVFEGDFLEASYGYRPKRGCHEALKSLDRAIMANPVSFVVEVDIKGFFNHVDHKWLMECLRQRISDPSLLSLVWRNLKAGVLDEGKFKESEEGTPQGGVISPILSNIYLHYVLDLWFEKKLSKELRGHAELIRYCDDFIVCAQYRSDADRVLAEIKARLAKFGLEVSPEKTRIIEFGRFAKLNAEKRGGKPDTFDFLGFMHFCGTTLKGRFRVGRKTSGKRFRAKLKAMNTWLKAVRNAEPLPEWWRTFRAKLEGHCRYYGVSGNSRSISSYFHWAIRMVYKWINRRSQKRSYTWAEFVQYLERHPLPKVRIVHHLYAASAAS